MSRYDRRTVLATLAGTAAAGCLGGPRVDVGTDADGGAPSTDGTATTARIDAVDGGWPLPRRDPAGTRYDADGTLPERRPGVAWRADTGRDGVWVVVGDGTVYAAGGNEVVALEAATGERLWEQSLGAGALSRGPALGDALYAGVDDEVVALSPDDGSRLWTLSTGTGPVRHVVPTGDAIYVSTRGPSDGRGAVHAFADGEERWRAPSEDGRVARFGDLAVGQDAVFAVAENAGSVTWHRALDRATGERRWEAGELNHSGSLTLAAGRLLAGGFSGTVLAQATSDGSEAWRVEVEPVVGDIATRGDAAYVHSLEADAVVGLSLEDGDRRWQRAAHDPIAGAGDGLLVSTSKGLRALEAATGETRWARTLEDPPKSLAVAGGTVFVGGKGGSVVALAAD